MGSGGRALRLDVAGRTRPARRGGDLRPALLLGLVVVAVHVAVSGRYGYHRDELYYVVGGQHPAAGYVDHPPVVPLLARLVTAVVGDHLWPLRLVAGAAHAAVVVVTGLLARELGGRRWAIGAAALFASTAPFLVAVGSLFQTVILEQLLASLVLLLLVRLLKGGDERWWLAVGGLLGLALETKWTIGLLVACLAAGFVILQPLRSHLRSAWLWGGALVAVLVWSPNLLWQAANGWPTLEFASNNNSNVQDDGGRVMFVVEQVLLPGPLAVPVLVAGLVWLWRNPPWRVFALATGLLLGGLLVVGGKSYYVALVYPVVFAAGAVSAEGWATTARRRGLVIGALASGLVVLPAMAPVAPQAVYRDVFHAVNEEMGEQFGWPELADQVAAAYADLPSDERAGARIVTASYGEAAALDLYGPARGIPEGAVLSGHNSYHHWWPDGEPSGVVIFVRYPPGAVARHCGEVEQVGTVTNDWGMDNEVAGSPIVLCRDLRSAPENLREGLRHYE
jgi:hypothetical protein